MPFLNPLFLFGLLAAGVPVLVHLLGRRHAKEREFPAIDFLLASQKRLAARRRIRHLLLLLARATLVAAVAIALARPLLRGAAVSGGGQPVSAVVILDRTASMAVALADGGRAFERAQTLLTGALEALPSGSEAVVLALDRRPQRLSRGFVDIRSAVAAVAAAKVGAAHGDVGPALAEARVLLEGARRSSRVVYVASDLRRSSFAVPATITELEAEFVLLDALGEDPGAGAGDVAIVAAARTGEDPSTLRVEASQFGGVRGDRGVRVLAGGKLVNRGVLSFGDGDRAATLVAVPDGVTPGAEVQVELADPDPLPVNDRFHLYAPRPSGVRVLIADGAPSPNLYRDEVFYLKRALEADPAQIRVRVEDATDGELALDAKGDDEVDVVILANVGELTADAARRLTARVESGLGLLVTVGDRTSAATLAQRLGRLLPAAPRSIVTRRTGEPPIRLASPSATHPVILPFDSSVAGEALESAVFNRFLSAEASPQALVLLSYSNGLPALIEGRHGAGRVALLTTSVDRDWTDLPVKPSYLPLMSRLVLHLGGALERSREHRFLVGDRVEIELDGGLKGALRIERPDGAWSEPVPAPDGRYMIEDTDALGGYRAFLDEQREPGLDFVVNLDPAESALGRVAPEGLGAILGPGAQLSGDAVARVTREDETVWPILAIAVLAFLAESLLGRRKADADEVPSAPASAARSRQSRRAA